MRLQLILILALVVNTLADQFSLEDEDDDLGFDMDDDEEANFYLGGYNNDPYYDEEEGHLTDAIPMNSDMSCYECKEYPDESGSLRCDLEQNDVLLAAINEELVKVQVPNQNENPDMDEADAKMINTFFRSIAKLNPCRIMAGRILKLMNSQENEQYHYHHLLPFFSLDLTGKDERSQYEELKSAVSTIQFQKRQNSDWMTVEVQMRNSEEPFSFILSDLGHELLVVPDNSIFYTAL